MRPLMIARALTGAAVPALLAVSCMTPDQLDTLQTDVSQMRAQIEALRKQSEANTADIEALKATSASGEQAELERVAEDKRQIDALKSEIRTLTNRLDDTQHRISSLSASAAAAASRPPAPPPPPPAEGAAPSQGPGVPPVGEEAPAEGEDRGSGEDLFNGAYADYSKGSYAPAVIGFETYLRQFPSSSKADDALYWIGLCHYDQGEYAEAIASFDRLVRAYPEGDKAPAALLKKGLALLEMSRTAQGVVQLQFVIEKYPRSEEARIARDRLKELGVKP